MYPPSHTWSPHRLRWVLRKVKFKAKFDLQMPHFMALSHVYQTILLFYPFYSLYPMWIPKLGILCHIIPINLVCSQRKLLHACVRGGQLLEALMKKGRGGWWRKPFKNPLNNIKSKHTFFCKSHLLSNFTKTKEKI